MKTAIAVATSLLLCGVSYAEPVDYSDGGNRTAGQASPIEISLSATQPGTARGPLNNSLFNNRSTYGHVLSDLELGRDRAQEVATKAETSPMEAGMFANRSTYGHVLSDPRIAEARERKVAAAPEPLSAIEISMFEDRPGVERRSLDNSMFSNRSAYGHILSDLE